LGRATISDREAAALVPAIAIGRMLDQDEAAMLIRRLGVPEKIAYDALHTLDKNDGRNSGFPQKQKFWDNRRYYPAVRAWLDHTNGLQAAGLKK
jgi:hypothetical protein